MKFRKMLILALLIALSLTSCTASPEPSAVTESQASDILNPTGDPSVSQPNSKPPNPSKSWPEPSISSVALTEEAYAALSHAVTAMTDVLTQDNAIPECTMRAGGVLLKKKYEGSYIVPDQLNVVAEYFSTIAYGQGPKDGKLECYNGATVFLTDAQWTGKTGEFAQYTQ